MSIVEKLTTIVENEPKVFEAGKQSEYNRFWDNYQDNGNRTIYQYAYAYNGWTDECYDPLHNIVCSGNGAANMFAYNQRITDTTKGGRISITFGTSASYTFNWCTSLQRTHIIVNENTAFSYTFNNCTSLRDFIIEGEIAQNGFNVQSSPLCYDSLMMIVDCLSYKGDDTSGTDWVITLGAANIATLGSDCEMITEKGWRYE